jgi:hypothetical protein
MTEGEADVKTSPDSDEDLRLLEMLDGEADTARRRYESICANHGVTPLPYP